MDADTNAERGISRYDAWTGERVVRWACVKRRVMESSIRTAQHEAIRAFYSEVYPILNLHLRRHAATKTYITYIYVNRD